jgi:hypothetical protein
MKNEKNFSSAGKAGCADTLWNRFEDQIPEVSPHSQEKIPREVRGISGQIKAIFLSGGFFHHQRAGCRGGISIYDTHLLPVIGELLAAIEAGNVCAELLGAFVSARSSAYGHGETKTGVAAAKHRVDEFREHVLPPTTGAAAAATTTSAAGPTFNTLDSKW